MVIALMEYVQTRLVDHAVSVGKVMNSTLGLTVVSVSFRTLYDLYGVLSDTLQQCS